MSSFGTGTFRDEPSQKDIRQYIRNYFTQWPLFLISLLIFIGTGMVYARYAKPKFLVTTSLLVGQQSSKPNSEDLIESVMNGKKEVNLSNEILMLSTSSLMERTIAEKNFNISYTKKGRFSEVNIYDEAPFTVTSAHVKANKTITLTFKDLDDQGGKFYHVSDKIPEESIFKWGVPFQAGGQVFTSIRKGIHANLKGEYVVIWRPPIEAASEISKNLLIKVNDPKTSSIDLALKWTNLQEGIDILNTLCAEYNKADIESRSKLTESTVQFIDDRLLLISGELKGVEGNLEDYQGNNQLVDIKGQSTQQLENANSSLKTIKDLAVQQGVVNLILDYFSKSENNNKLVPSSLGLNDGTLSSLITQYNELQLKKEREAPLVAPNSTVMQDLNSQLGSLKSSILESLNNVGKNLRLQEGNFQQQNRQYRNFLSSVPHNERILQEIKRKQGITEGLYLYLLQKREEAAISINASKAPHYRQLDLATGYGPVEPNLFNLIMYTSLLGLILPIGVIYFKNLLNDKIADKKDLHKKISPPLLGEISHVSKRIKIASLAILDRSLVGEQFRAMRTSLTFLLSDKEKKTILITSSLSGEGKSFISLNLAAVFAIPGKKVALLEFDTRKPAIANILNLDNTSGLTNFLDQKLTNLIALYRTLPDIPSLHIFPSGPILTNPADLLLSNNMPKLFDILRANYDYVIIDSPPATLVSDAQILSQYADITLFVIRENYSKKAQIDFINDLSQNETFKQINVVLNDTKVDKNATYSYYT